MNNGWITDDIGIRRFTSPEAPGWVVTIYPEVPTSIYVDTGNGDTEVDVSRDSIMVFGEVSRGYDGYAGARFTIPWVIVREIVRFQDSV